MVSSGKEAKIASAGSWKAGLSPRKATRSSFPRLMSTLSCIYHRYWVYQYTLPNPIIDRSNSDTPWHGSIALVMSDPGSRHPAVVSPLEPRHGSLQSRANIPYPSAEHSHMPSSYSECHGAFVRYTSRLCASEASFPVLLYGPCYILMSYQSCPILRPSQASSHCLLTPQASLQICLADPYIVQRCKG